MKTKQSVIVKRMEPGSERLTLQRLSASIHRGHVESNISAETGTALYVDRKRDSKHGGKTLKTPDARGLFHAATHITHLTAFPHRAKGS